MDALGRAGAEVGVRVSLRVGGPADARDLIGLVVGLDDEVVTLERRGATETVRRADALAARVVPLVSRGRNPHHFDHEQVRRLAHDPIVGGSGQVWVGRLSDIVDRLDHEEVVGSAPARHGGSAARVFGEWAVIRLEAEADLVHLAAWAARCDARNVAVTGPAAAGVRGLALLQARD